MVLCEESQQKVYLHVFDLIEAMLLVRFVKPSTKIELVNIDQIDNGVTVRNIAEWVFERINPDAFKIWLR